MKAPDETRQHKSRPTRPNPDNNIQSTFLFFGGVSVINGSTAGLKSWILTIGGLPGAKPFITVRSLVIVASPFHGSLTNNALATFQHHVGATLQMAKTLNPTEGLSSTRLNYALNLIDFKYFPP